LSIVDSTSSSSASIGLLLLLSLHHLVSQDEVQAYRMMMMRD
jgi:hypothetical protein